MKPQVPRPAFVPVTTIAEQSLAETGHSIFRIPEFEVCDRNNRPILGNWEGPVIQRTRLHRPGIFVKQWLVSFYPNAFHTFLPVEFTEEEATMVASNMLELLNIRRKGA